MRYTAIDRKTADTAHVKTIFSHGKVEIVYVLCKHCGGGGRPGNENAERNAVTVTSVLAERF
jgi:hypothetical protein